MKNTEASAFRYGRSTWGEVLAAALPLAAFMGVFYFASPVRRFLVSVDLYTVYQILWTDAIRAGVMPMAFYLVLLGGVLAAWLKDFPRWSYTYLGWLLIFVISGLGVSGLYDPYLRLIWGPFALTLLLAVLLRRSRQPLRALWEGWRRDWTLSCFAMLGIVEFLVWASFDEMPGSRRPWQYLCAAVLVVGALAYMRASGKVGRIAALLGSVMANAAISVGVTAYYWNGVQLPHMQAPADGSSMLLRGLLAWSALLIALMTPTLLAVILKRVFPNKT